MSVESGKGPQPAGTLERPKTKTTTKTKKGASKMKEQKIITAEIRRAIEKTPYGSTDGQHGNAKVIARFFYPRGDNAFYVIEGGQASGEKWDGHSVFGYCRHDGHEFELGRFDLDELINTKAEIAWTYGTVKVGIERDICVDVKKLTIREAMKRNGETVPEWWGDEPEADKPIRTSAAVAKANNDAIQAEAAKIAAETKAAKVETEKPVLETKAAKTETPAKKRTKKRKAEKSGDGIVIAQEDEPKPEAVKYQGTPYAEFLTTWRQLTHENEHTRARIDIATWCAANAKAEADEFALVLDDLRYIERGSAEGMSDELLAFRDELTDELGERIARVFGGEAEKAIMATL